MVSLVQYDWCYKKGIFGHEDRHAQREDNAKTHREKMVVWLMWCLCKPRNTKDCRQTLEVARMDSPPRAIRESTALLTPWFWTSRLQTCETIHVGCFKTPSWLYFVTEALGHEPSIITAIAGIYPSRVAANFQESHPHNKISGEKMRDHFFLWRSPSRLASSPLALPESRALSQAQWWRKECDCPWPVSLQLQPDGSESPEVHSYVWRNGFPNKIRFFSKEVEGRRNAG